MNVAQRLWTAAIDDHPPESAAGPHDARDWQERDEGRNSNEMAAQWFASLAGQQLTERQLAVAAPIVHFTFGAAVGAAYGLYLERRDDRPRSGIGLGTALWLTADEIAMPLLGLSRSTLDRPIEMHAQSFVSHLVFGVVAERVRRQVIAA